jgi:hypothetical protein
LYRLIDEIVLALSSVPNAKLIEIDASADSSLLTISVDAPFPAIIPTLEGSLLYPAIFAKRLMPESHGKRIECLDHLF